MGIVARSVGYPDEETTNGDVIPKLAVQYIENHDHERFLCNFGLINPDEAGNPLFLEGDRNRWYMLQSYLIALIMSKGIPMLWQGQELAENYFFPTSVWAAFHSFVRFAGITFMMAPGARPSRWSESSFASAPLAVIFEAGRCSSSTIGTDTRASGCSCLPDTRARNTPSSR